MTSPIKPAAETAVLPNPMSDVIDSLKRLERVGSEYSKTTEKLIAAAADLSAKIVEICSTRPGDEIVILHRSSAAPSGEIGGAEVYTISDRQVACHSEYVAASRGSALRFSKAIADGLLSEIADTLQKRLAESPDGLPILQAAGEFITLRSMKTPANTSPVWTRIRLKLTPPMTIPNWSALERAHGSFRVVAVEADSVVVEADEIDGQRHVPRRDFELISDVWADYRDLKIPRNQLTERCRHTTYVISILQWLDNN